MSRLMFLFSCLFFIISCNDTGNTGIAPIKPSMKCIGEIKLSYYTNDTLVGHQTCSFTYDDGRMITIMEQGDLSSTVSTLSFNTQHNQVQIVDYTVLNGEINTDGYISFLEVQDGIIKYQYDSIGYLRSIKAESYQGDDTYECYYKWTNGNLAQATSDGDEWQLKYNDVLVPNNINIDLSRFVLMDPESDIELAFMPNFDTLAISCLSLFGEINKNYVIEATSEYSHVYYTWEYDKDGYPIKCISDLSGDVDEVRVEYEFSYK